jgi:molybdate transport system substrate-binding protein
MHKIIAGTLALACAPFLFATAAASEVSLHGGGHFQGAGQPLVEAYAAKTGGAANYTPGNTGDGGFLERLNNGAIIDVIVLNKEDMERQVAAGLVRPDSVVDLARDGYGMGVRKGAPIPDVSTHDGWREALLSAKAIGRRYPDPDSNSGRIVELFLDNLGILSEAREKSVYIDNSSEALVAGDVDVVLWSYTEILRADAMDGVASFPPELSEFVTQAVGIPASSKNVAEAQSFIDFMTSPEGGQILARWGMDPLAGD